MGKTFTGGVSHEGNVSMLTPEQEALYSQGITQLGPQFLQAFGSFLQPQNMEDYQDLFQQAYVDPAMQTLQRQILPGIQQQFADAGAGSSSALNQALAQSATDLSTQLGQQFGNFYQQQQANQLGALGAFMPYSTQQTFSPMIHEQQGLLGPAVGGAFDFAGKSSNYWMPHVFSSEKVKENIRDYGAGVDAVRSMNVKQYDYIEDVGGKKDQVGLIAEEVPPEITEVHDDILHVNLYGLIGILTNAVKQLDKRLQSLEEAV